MEVSKNQEPCRKTGSQMDILIHARIVTSEHPAGPTTSTFHSEVTSDCALNADYLGNLDASHR